MKTKRVQLIRQTVPVEKRKKCAQCGWRTGRFRYNYEFDAVGPGWHVGDVAKHAFCCLPCWEDYHR